MGWGLFKSCRVLTLSAVLWASLAGAETDDPFNFSLTGSVSRAVDRVESASYFLIEPDFTYHASDSSHLNLYLAVERPFDSHLNWRLPKTVLAWHEDLDFFSSARAQLRVSSTILEWERWNTDGYMLRPGVALQVEKDLTPHLTLLLRAGPWAQLSQFRQRTDGSSLPAYGFTERIGLEGTWGDLIVDLRLILEQFYAAQWKNNYATVERVAYRVSDDFTVGALHELLSNVVDDSTGGYRSIRVYDDRQSRFSAYVEVSF